MKDFYRKLKWVQEFPTILIPPARLFKFAGFLALAILLQVNTYAFEGKVVYSVTDDNIDMKVVYYNKGDRSRAEIHGRTGLLSVFIVDRQAKQLTRFLENRREFYVVDLSMETFRTYLGQSDELVEKARRKAKSDVVNTGRRATILGHSTEIIQIKGKGPKLDVYVTGDMGEFSPQVFRLYTPALEKMRHLNILFGYHDNFLLKLEENGGKGRKPLLIEATEIEEMEVPDSLFDVPTDYDQVAGPRGAEIGKSRK